MKSRFSNGFALPAVLMSSIVMLIVMLAAVTSTVSSRVSLESQYYNQLSKTAGEAGVAYAKACMAQNSGTPQWTDAKPLKPYTDCSGNQLSGFTCSDNSTDPRCSVSVINGNIITSFSVPVPLPDTTGAFTNISSNGSVSMLRSSGGDVWRQYQQKTKTIKQTVNGASEIGWKQSESGHWKQIVVGGEHTCAIASNGQVYCWGLNNYGQLGNNSTSDSHVPAAVVTSGVLNGLTIKSISSQGFYNCSIASNDQAYCWGQNSNGQLGNNSTSDSHVPVAVVTSGVLDGLTIKSISEGYLHTCAVASNDKTFCWGDNTYGQLGNNSTAQSSIPVAVNATGVLSGLSVKSMIAGSYHNCVIASNDQVYCWGYNGYGQLGNNSKVNSLAPTSFITTGVLNGLTIKEISAGYGHTCVIASDNQPYCLGYNYYGQLGNNTNSSNPDSIVPVAVVTSGALSGLTVKTISAADYHTCVIASNDQAYCWGGGSNGSLGNSWFGDSHAPVAVTITGVLSGLNIKSISAESQHTCAIASNDQAYCWGDNNYGQLGNNLTANSNIPVAVVSSAVLNNLSTQTITTGYGHTCSLASNDQAYCWGRNNYGQLGNNSTVDSQIPVAVATTRTPISGLGIRSLSAGYSHTCAIASNNQVYCWGQNNYGQLGNNSTVDSQIPVAVATTGTPISGLGIKSVTAEYNHTCAIASNDQAYCWGYGAFGQLGNNSTAQSNVPVAVTNTGVLNGLTIKSISAGNYITCIIASNSQAYCWGGDDYGRLGDNSTNNSSVPVAVTNTGVLNGLTIKSISAGANHTCAIASNNQAYCWGYNGNGQFGDNSTNNSLVPVAVVNSGALNSVDLKSISAGYVHTCAIASNNQAYCWGYNNFGQLGNNSTINQLVPASTNEAIGFAPKSIWASY